MVNRLSVKVSAPRMDGSSVWLVGCLDCRGWAYESWTGAGEYFSSLLVRMKQASGIPAG